MSERALTRANHARDSHGHGTTSTSSRKLAFVAALNLVGFLAELAGGLLFGSVALLSDAFHMLFDAGAYLLAFGAASLADRYGESDRWSYGLHRLKPIAAFLNGILLLPMVGFILWESYQRFLDPVAIGTAPTLLIATGGLLINVGSIYVLQGGEMSLNEKGAFYHLLGDAGGSVAVIVSTIVIEVTGLRIIDPITAGLIAIAILWSASKVVGWSGAIFLHQTPPESDELRATLSGIDGVDRVDDVHVWQICSQITVATAHISADVETLAEAETVRERVYDAFRRNGVDHATVELYPATTDRSRQLGAHGH